MLELLPVLDGEKHTKPNRPGCVHITRPKGFGSDWVTRVTRSDPCRDASARDMRFPALHLLEDSN